MRKFDKSKITCNYCNQKGHKEKACFKKRNDEKRASKPESVNATDSLPKAPGGVEKASESHYATSISIDGMACRGVPCQPHRSSCSA